MHGTDHLDALRRDASSAPVVLFASRLTDLRELEARLAEVGLEHRVVTLSMSDAASRDRFHVLEEWTGRKTLPQVFLDGRFIGGPSELLAHPRLSREAASAGRWLGYAGLIPFVAALLGFVFSADARLGGKPAGRERAAALVPRLAHGAHARRHRADAVVCTGGSVRALIALTANVPSSRPAGAHYG